MDNQKQKKMEEAAYSWQPAEMVNMSWHPLHFHKGMEYPWENQNQYYTGVFAGKDILCKRYDDRISERLKVKK